MPLSDVPTAIIELDRTIDDLNLKIVHPHTGGVLPYLMGRVEEQTEVKGRGREHITKPPMAYYENVYLNLVSPSALGIRYAYDFIGPNRLLFGRDLSIEERPWMFPRRI